MTDKPKDKPNNQRPLEGRIAVVTGAQQGIGREIALELGTAGANIVATYLDDKPAAQTLSDSLEKLGSRCHLVGADLSDPKQIDTLFSEIEKIGAVDILINNAAMFPRADLMQLSHQMWQQTLDVNLTAPFLCTQLAAKSMIASHKGGSIINITSGAAFRSSPRAAHYVSSKAGLVGLTRACALELAPHNIRVNAIAPGLTDTAQPRMGMSEQELADAAQLIPLGKIADASDIAPTVRFLASDAAAHVTGQTWHINGGQYLT